MILESVLPIVSTQVDVELAKNEACKPEEDDVELRKKLWLRIGLYISGNN